MDKFVVEGGQILKGTIAVSGAKNAALPALAATLLTEDSIELSRIPEVRDVQTMVRLLKHIGVSVQKSVNGCRFKAKAITSPEAPYDLVKTMRASSLVLGPLVARTGRAKVSMPGGCAIGARPIELHTEALEQLGATISKSHGYIEAKAPNGLHGERVRFKRVTVTGTEDIMMAAVLAKGETILENAALEPEIVDLATLLKKMGASIDGAGTNTIRIRGVDQLKGTHHSIIADRIEAGTFLIAGLVAGQGLTLTGVDVTHLEALIEKMVETGAEISYPKDNTVRVEAGHALRAVDIATQEYPGFPTDMQAQWTALMTQAEGQAQVTENIFENRFMHISELSRMGAEISLIGNCATVRGKTALSGAAVMASDLRASAGLLIAALAASGETVIDRVYHIDRGYESIEKKLATVGAHIRRLS